MIGIKAELIKQIRYHRAEVCKHQAEIRRLRDRLFGFKPKKQFPFGRPSTINKTKLRDVSFIYDLLKREGKKLTAAQISDFLNSRLDNPPGSREYNSTVFPAILNAVIEKHGKICIEKIVDPGKVKPRTFYGLLEWEAKL